MSITVQLVPALVLAILAFVVAALALVYSIYPLLPSHKLWKHGINFISNNNPTPSNGAHIWIAIVEVASISMFVWQSVMDEVERQDGFRRQPWSTAGAARTWFMLSARHTLMVALSALAFYSAKRGAFLGWRKVHFFVWAPLILVCLVGTILSAVGARNQGNSLPIGLIVFSTVATFTTLTLLWLSQRQTALRKKAVTVSSVSEYPERKWSSYSTADVAALKGGPSWITSYTSSQRPSISAFSFSTTRTKNASGNVLTSERLESPCIPKPVLLSAPTSNVGNSLSPSDKSSQQKLSGGTSSSVYYTADEYGKLGSGQATPMSTGISQTSWITEPSIAPPTMSSWSFPVSSGTRNRSQGRPPPSAFRATSTLSRQSMFIPPVIAQSVDTLHMNGVFPSTDIDQPTSLETGLLPSTRFPQVPPLVTTPERPHFQPGKFGWLLYNVSSAILALPYLIISLTDYNTSNKAASVMFILAMTLPSFILAFCIAFRPFPFPEIPSTRTDDEPQSPCTTAAGSPTPFLPTLTQSSTDFRSTSRLHKRSASATVSVFQVQRTDDIWLWNGDAIDAKNKLARAMSFLSPKPKLAVFSSTSLDCYPNEKGFSKSETSLPLRSGGFPDRGMLNLSPRQYAEYVQRASELEIHMAVDNSGHNYGSVRSTRSLDSTHYSSSRGHGRTRGSISHSQSRLSGFIDEGSFRSDIELRRREALALIEARAASNLRKDNSIHASRELSKNRNHFVKRITPPTQPSVASTSGTPSMCSRHPSPVSKRTYKAHRKDGSQRRRRRNSPRLTQPNKRVSFALDTNSHSRFTRSVRSCGPASISSGASPSGRRELPPSRIPVASFRLRKQSTISRKPNPTANGGSTSHQ